MDFAKKAIDFVRRTHSVCALSNAGLCILSPLQNNYSFQSILIFLDVILICVQHFETFMSQVLYKLFVSLSLLIQISSGFDLNLSLATSNYSEGKDTQ